MTASGIYQVIARRGRECGVEVFPHRFRHHFSHTWLDRGGAEGDLMELNGWTSRRSCAATAPAPAAPAAHGHAAATTASWRRRRNPAVARLAGYHARPACIADAIGISRNVTIVLTATARDPPYVLD